MEKYRPTPDQIEAAKLGSNELFQYDVLPHHQPNRLRQSENMSIYSGWKDGIYYLNGVPQNGGTIYASDTFLNEQT